MEPLGAQIRQARHRLGLTLDELAGRSGISKPYLSLIETGRVTNPPSDAKLRVLEQTLGFGSGELLGQAHLLRTPRDIRAMFATLVRESAASEANLLTVAGETDVGSEAGQSKPDEEAPGTALGKVSDKALAKPAGRATGVDLDAAYLSGVLHELVERTTTNVETVRMNAIPIVNRVSAGYPTDFTDLAYPRGVADDFIGCPNLSDADAFAARVHGDSMRPRYDEGDIVIFSPAAACRHGDDCFVRFDDGQTTFKRVFFESNEAGESILRLQPRNEKYRAQVIEPERVTGLYRAVYRYQAIESE